MPELHHYRHLDIDWNMTPEDAVTLYLEWGNNSWRGQFQPVRSKDDYYNYFVVYNWDEEPRAILIRRNSEQAQELWSRELPPKLAAAFREDVGGLKGVYPPSDAVKRWLHNQFDN
ncbi:MAG: DVU0772 family protein [Desulfovibrionaceae bacterium]